ncbi:hypothetical protein QL189_19815 [Cronobacter turicensis]|uniref:hypothetical protein n=1 Tax=Cronobacter turicensis TaxID=413502 RepID=UPI001D217008|nr:hypothetical protein [Cronobacter turicensis]EGT4494261.1 hypothetical protein [Cronobacter turicensis]EKM0439325.1 hypothetical protein [Cronobacter turicensis]ELY4323841.1 hypothetical protein [Cronobacter turicensis]ELY5943998.1 hypothetical protein [Cronobacter turicensis]ELY5965363.1 hypothetical protein [Cronobacter turicensis]
MENLETEYPGDAEWGIFYRVYEPMYQSQEIVKLAVELGGHKDIATVIYGLLGAEECFEWIHKKIPILDGITPFECIKSVSLMRRLKTALMTMPC